MKRILTLIVLCLLLCLGSAAQQNPGDAPATREDVEKILEVTHSREMMAQTVDAMLKPMHQMIHEQFLKDKNKLPADFETRMNRMMDDFMKTFPWNDMLDSMIPVYQKHLTKADVNTMVAFYSTATGQKLLKEMPQMMAEAMQSWMPMLQKHMEAMQERVQQEIAQMLKDSQPASKADKKPVSN